MAFELPQLPYAYDALRTKHRQRNNEHSSHKTP